MVDCGRTLSGVVSDNVGTKWWGESGGIVLLNYSGEILLAIFPRLRGSLTAALDWDLWSVVRGM